MEAYSIAWDAKRNRTLENIELSSKCRTVTHLAILITDVETSNAL